jgi:hypothetical protein
VLSAKNTYLTFLTDVLGILVAGGSGNGFQEVNWSVEFLDLSMLGGKWEVLPPLKKPRCCWPQMGFVGNNLFIMSGEKVPSQRVEKFNQNSGQWIEEDGTKLLMKRSQSRAIFTTSQFLTQCDSTQ